MRQEGNIVRESKLFESVNIIQGMNQNPICKQQAGKNIFKFFMRRQRRSFCSMKAYSKNKPSFFHSDEKIREQLQIPETEIELNNQGFNFLFSYGLFKFVKRILFVHLPASNNRFIIFKMIKSFWRKNTDFRREVF